MARHLPLKIQEQEIVVVVPGRWRDIVAAAVQTGEDIAADIAAAVEDKCVAEAVHQDMNLHAGEWDVP